MKIAICSDLHLEFGDLDLHNTENADVLILSGDIMVASDLTEFHYDEMGMVVTASASARERAHRFNDFIVRCCERFPQVVYVMGNHEHYHGDFSKSANLIRGTFGDLKNFHFLDTEWKIINGVLFFGGTLWTDMNKEDPITLAGIRGVMNDYRIIKNSNVGENCKLIPEDTVEEHHDFLRLLDSVLREHAGLPVVVVGHHAPSKQSTHPRYKTDFEMNGAYSSNLDEFILDHREIKLWTHGHTHEPFDYMIGTTRIVCNPRGYDGYEQRADDFELKYVEV